MSTPTPRPGVSSGYPVTTPWVSESRWTNREPEWPVPTRGVWNETGVRGLVSLNKCIGDPLTVDGLPEPLPRLISCKNGTPFLETHLTQEPFFDTTQNTKRSSLVFQVVSSRYGHSPVVTQGSRYCSPSEREGERMRVRDGGRKDYSLSLNY